MTTGAPGAVFFLGTRAHYQVLQQPENQFDIENGNTETIYQNPSTWKSNGLTPRECYGRYSGMAALQDCHNGTGPFADRAGYSVLNDVNATDDNDKEITAKKRNKRQPTETTRLCSDDMKPSQLNNVADDNASPKGKSRRSLLTFLSSLARRKKRLGADQMQYLQHIESALTNCTYRESCRCLECQSSYFDCDEDEEDYESDDDSEYTMYVAQMQTQREEPPPEEEEEDEVFVDEIPDDNTSTDLLLEPKKMSVSSESSEDPETMNLEVAAGTPLLLNFLLTHPITCAIQ